MPVDPQLTVYYNRARFASRLPRNFRYTASHFWLCETEPALWRIGLTKFALRMLGDLVEFAMAVTPGEMLTQGQVVGSIEGFKAISDVYSVATGCFVSCNPALESDAALLDSDPYDQGWLYCVRGEPESDSVDVQGYINILDATIDKMLAKAASGEDDNCQQAGKS
jgi:glycine cleavage system H protein